MVSGIVKVETLLYPVLVKPNCLDCSRYEEFVKMSEAHAEDLSGMVRLMIGFFVSQLFRRWWWQFQVCRETRCHWFRGELHTNNVPIIYPPWNQKIGNADYIALLLLGFVVHKDDPKGKKEEAKLYRRTISRYVNLAIIETLRSVSLRTAKMFPTYEDLVESSELTLNAIAKSIYTLALESGSITLLMDSELWPRPN